MKLDDLKKQYEALGAEIAKLEAEKEWPKEGDGYYFICEDGGISNHIIQNTNWCNGALRIGNCFRTREEAEAERDARLVVAELKRQPGAKMFESCARNYCVVVTFKYDKVSACPFSVDASGFGQAYFDSEESCLAAIKVVGEDRIFKAVRWWAMGVTE